MSCSSDTPDSPDPADSPAAKEALYQQGFQQFAARDYEQAVSTLEKALEIDPDYADALRTIAMAHFRNEDFEQAVVYGQRLAEVEPDDVMSHSSLSLFLMKAGRIQDAEDVQAKARTLDWKQQLKDKNAGG